MVSKNESFSLNPEKRFHLLKDGQRRGPFTAEEVAGMLSSNEIFWDDLLSDGSNSQWIRISHHSEFRSLHKETKKNNSLPTAPSEVTFKRSEVENLISGRNNFNQKEIDFLVGMASIAKKSDKGKGETNALSEFLEEREKLEQHSRWQKWGLSLIAGTIAFILLGSYLSSQKGKTPEALMTEATPGGQYNPETNDGPNSTNSTPASNSLTVRPSGADRTTAVEKIEPGTRKIPDRLKRRMPSSIDADQAEDEREENKANDLIEPDDIAAMDRNEDEESSEKDKRGIRPLRKPQSEETTDSFYPEKESNAATPEDNERADSISSEDQIFDQ